MSAPLRALAARNPLQDPTELPRVSLPTDPPPPSLLGVGTATMSVAEAANGLTWGAPGFSRRFGAFASRVLVALCGTWSPAFLLKLPHFERLFSTTDPVRPTGAAISTGKKIACRFPPVCFELRRSIVSGVPPARRRGPTYMPRREVQRRASDLVLEARNRVA